MRKAVLTTVALVLLSVSAASAESFDFSVTLDAALTVTSPNDNYWGEYSTADPQPVNVSIRNGQSVDLTLSDVAFLLPSGSTINSATMSLVLPEYVTGTAQGFPEENLPPPDQTNRDSVAPTFGIGSLGLIVQGLYQGNPYPDNGIPSAGGLNFSLPSDLPFIDGNEISTGAPVVTLDVAGGMSGINAITPGYNWAGYVNATGTAEVPYTLDISGTYTPPVPEPSSLVLLGTGALGLAGAVRRRFCRTRCIMGA